MVIQPPKWGLIVVGPDGRRRTAYPDGSLPESVGPTPIQPDPGGDEVVLATSVSGTYNGSALDPGDTITLAGGTRSAIMFDNLQGTEAKPILIRNDPTSSSPVIIRRSSASSGGGVLRFRNCKHVIVDGLHKWVGAGDGLTYGIRSVVTTSGDRPTAMLWCFNLASDIRFRGVEVDGGWDGTAPQTTGGDIGFFITDTAITQTANPTAGRNNFVFEYCYAHDLYGEGFYLGQNYRLGGVDADPLEGRDWRVSHCLTERTGRDGIDIKFVVGGTNELSHNVCRLTGLRQLANPSLDTGGQQGMGIILYECTASWSVHSNLIEECGGHGFSHWNQFLPTSYGSATASLYNNVIYDVAKSGNYIAAGSGAHIAVGSASGVATVVYTSYQNTLVQSGRNGITQHSGSVARDNIVVDCAATAIVGGTSTNNRTGTAAAQNFQNAAARNFRLTATSPARNSGSGSGFPSVDFDGVARPQGAAVDQGAFEYI